MSIEVINSEISLNKGEYFREKVLPRCVKTVVVVDNQEECKCWEEKTIDLFHIKPLPKNKDERYEDSVLSYIEKGESIVISKEYFIFCSLLDYSVFSEYSLILACSLPVVEKVIPDNNRKEWDIQIEEGVMEIDADRNVKFNKVRYTPAWFHMQQFKRWGMWINWQYASKGLLKHHKESNCVWHLPINLLTSFTNVFIYQPLFKSSQMKAYLDKNEVDYVVKHVGGKPSEYKHLVKIYTQNSKGTIVTLDNLGDGLCFLDVKNFTKADEVEVKRRGLQNYFVSKMKAPKNDRMWTSPKKEFSTLCGSRHKDTWMSLDPAKQHTCDAHTLAYMGGTSIPRAILDISNYLDYPIDQDMYALSELVQWIWRSAIRNGEEINLYIPSSRMRNLLVQWLNDGYVDSIPHTEMKNIV